MIKIRYSKKGNPIISKDLQKAVKIIVQGRGMFYCADQLGVDVEVIGKILVKDFPRKSRGISTADIRATKRTINKIRRVSEELDGGHPSDRKGTNRPSRPARKKPSDKVTIVNIKT